MGVGAYSRSHQPRPAEAEGNQVGVDGWERGLPRPPGARMHRLANRAQRRSSLMLEARRAGQRDEAVRQANSTVMT